MIKTIYLATWKYFRLTWICGLVKRDERDSIVPNLSDGNDKTNFSQLVSGRDSRNPAIWLDPGEGEIFSSRPPQRAESVELILFRKRVSGNRQSFALLHFNKRLSYNPHCQLFPSAFENNSLCKILWGKTKCIVGYMKVANKLLINARLFTFEWQGKSL